MGGRSWSTAYAAILGMAVLGGCIGSISDEDFDRKVEERGGGLSEDLVQEAVAALQEEFHGQTVEFTSIGISPARITMEVRVPGTAEDLDMYAYGSSGAHGGVGLSDPEPVPNQKSLEGELFRANQVELDQLDEMVDEALAEADLAGGFAEGASISRTGTVGVSVNVKNERRTVYATFDANGTFLEVRE